MSKCNCSDLLTPLIPNTNNDCGCPEPTTPDYGCIPDISSTIEVTHEHSKLLNLDYEHSGHTGFAGLQTKTTNE